jgi:competence protein ComFB
MEIEKEYDFGLLKNDSERLMIEELGKQLPEIDICKCEDCILDIATLALNKIKPHYHVSLLGTLYAKAMDNPEYIKEIKKAVKDAVEKVKKNPSHD